MLHVQAFDAANMKLLFQYKYLILCNINSSSLILFISKLKSIYKKIFNMTFIVLFSLLEIPRKFRIQLKKSITCIIEERIEFERKLVK